MTQALRRTPELYFDCCICGARKHRAEFPPSAIATNKGRRRCALCPQVKRRKPRRADLDPDRAHPVAAISQEVPARCPHCGGYVQAGPYPSGHALGMGGFRCLNCGRGQG